MTKVEVMKFVSKEGLYSANRLFLNNEEICDWACEEHSLLWMLYKLGKTSDEYWLSEIDRFKDNLINTLSSKLFDLSLHQTIGYMENDTHCKIYTEPCGQSGESNIDAEVIEAIVKNISNTIDGLKNDTLAEAHGFDNQAEEMRYEFWLEQQQELN